METFKHSLTINGETREVEFLLVRDDFALSRKPVGMFQKGAGNKQWAHSVYMFRKPGQDWRMSTNVTILNRNGYNLIGWAEEITYASQHNSASGVPPKA